MDTWDTMNVVNETKTQYYLQVLPAGEDTEACKLPGLQGWLKYTVI